MYTVTITYTDQSCEVREDVNDVRAAEGFVIMTNSDESVTSINASIVAMFHVVEQAQ